jgi:Arc/MetJ-type ribon-helix-helix transcriptional regulator
MSSRSVDVVSASRARFRVTERDNPEHSATWRVLLREGGVGVARATRRGASWYTSRVTIQVPTRFRNTEVQALDELVADGVADSRSEVIRLAVARLSERHRRAKVGAAIVAAYRAEPQTAEEDAWALANAIALTEAEPW